jgi:hypothetical protein
MFRRFTLFVFFGLLGFACVSLTLAGDEVAQVKLVIGGKYLENNASWFIPLNAPNNTVALFSEQRDGFSVLNSGKTPITLKSITLTREAGVVEEEYGLQQYTVKVQPLNFQATQIPAGKRFDYYVRFYPVQSGERSATITLEFGDSSKFTYKVTGKGSYQAYFSKLAVMSQKLFGGPKTDEMVTGMVADKAGNVFFAGQVTTVKDKFAYDIFYGKVSKDGSLAWAKLWFGPFRDAARDAGQNDETGGPAGAVALDQDGYFYFTGATSPAKTNNNFAALVVKIDPATGTPVWEKQWRPEWPNAILEKHSAEAYALDVCGDYVYLTGVTGGAVTTANGLVFLLALSRKDGSILFQRYVDPTPTVTDRAYAVRADGHGNAYVGGLAGSDGLLIKFTGVTGKEPKVAWAHRLELGRGSNINALDLDAQGNLYASCDRRGATTVFTILKFDPQGHLLWGKTYTGGANKNNNCNFVKVVGDFVYAGGRTGQANYDAQMGDALFVKLQAKDGAEVWSMFHFSGKGPDEMAEHRVKGVAVQDGILYVLGQVYTGNYNGVRYTGYWYQGVGKIEDDKPGMSAITIQGNPVDMPKGVAKDAAPARELVDVQPTLPWQDATAKHDGNPPDGDLIYWQLKLDE